MSTDATSTKQAAWASRRAEPSVGMVAGRAAARDPRSNVARRPRSLRTRTNSIYGIPMAATVRVASYNILCSTLAPADRFCHCKPENLAAPVRLERILKQLDAEVRVPELLWLLRVAPAATPPAGSDRRQGGLRRSRPGRSCVCKRLDASGAASYTSTSSRGDSTLCIRATGSRTMTTWVRSSPPSTACSCALPLRPLHQRRSRRSSDRTRPPGRCCGHLGRRGHRVPEQHV